jgi:uncharacterized protein YggU (UPF0235/DUF167 family)
LREKSKQKKITKLGKHERRLLEKVTAEAEKVDLVTPEEQQIHIKVAAMQMDGESNSAVY